MPTSRLIIHQKTSTPITTFTTSLKIDSQITLRLQPYMHVVSFLKGEPIMRPLTFCLIFLLPVAVIAGSGIGRLLGTYASNARNADLRELEEKNHRELDQFKRHLAAQTEARNRRDQESLSQSKKHIADEQQRRRLYETQRQSLLASLRIAELNFQRNPSQSTSDEYAERHATYAAFLEEEVERRKPFDQWYSDLVSGLQAAGVLPIE